MSAEGKVQVVRRMVELLQNNPDIAHSTPEELKTMLRDYLIPGIQQDLRLKIFSEDDEKLIHDLLLPKLIEALNPKH